LYIHHCHFFFSSTDAIDGGQVSEFWNRDEEASGSEEDISDIDGGTKFISVAFVLLF